MMINDEFRPRHCQLIPVALWPWRFALCGCPSWPTWLGLRHSGQRRKTGVALCQKKSHFALQSAVRFNPGMRRLATPIAHRRIKAHVLICLQVVSCRRPQTPHRSICGVVRRPTKPSHARCFWSIRSHGVHWPMLDDVSIC